jgi:hypothetical protein
MMKVLLFGFMIFSLSVVSEAQSIVGKWQLARQSTCVEEELDDANDELTSEMKAMASPGRQILHLKDNNSAEESTKIINSRKSYNSKSLLYKYTGDALYILDKRSQTIIETFTIEQLSADSLIISNSARACETKVFVKIQ